MFAIDWTTELTPILYGLNAALLVSTLAIIGRSAVGTWFRSLGRIRRPRLVLHRPALVR
jgi:hypothetical protein